MTGDRSPPEYRHDAEGLRIIPRPMLLTREKPATDAETAVEALHLRLAGATVLFDSNGDEGRAGVFASIVAVNEFLSEQGIPTAAYLPLVAIMAALADADIGRASPMFATPKGRRGNAPKAQLDDDFEQFLAVITECCVQHQKGIGARPFVEPATRQAASLINGSPLRRQLARGVTRKQLRELRERVQGCRSGDSRRVTYDELTDARELMRDNPLGYAKALVAHPWVSVPQSFRPKRESRGTNID
jgi:hypothetical protein